MVSSTVNPSQSITLEQMNTIDQLHRHFANLAYWMRTLIISNKYNMANKFDVYGRIFEEPREISNIIEPFIGREKTHEYEALMTRLITTFPKLINNLLSQNNRETETNLNEMLKAADELALFFTRINPRWSKDQWGKLLQEWIQMAYNETQALVTDNYMGEINLFDSFVNQSYLIADYITSILIPDISPEDTVSSQLYNRIEESEMNSMPMCRRGKPEFNAEEKVASLVFHPPEITNGTMVTIVKPHPILFYAVMLPNRELHRWIADFELKALNPREGEVLKPGDMAVVISDEGHGHMIKKGMTVRIEKAFGDTYLYDIILPDGEYHRWLAEFELVRPA